MNSTSETATAMMTTGMTPISATPAKLIIASQNSGVPTRREADHGAHVHQREGGHDHDRGQGRDRQRREEPGRDDEHQGDRQRADHAGQLRLRAGRLGDRRP